MSDRLTRTALKVARPTLNDIAGATGITRASLDAYQFKPDRRPPPHARERLALFLSDHAERLREIAEELRGGAYQAPKGEA